MRALLIALAALAVAAPPASAVPLVALTPGNGLLYLDSASPGAVSSAPVSGIPGGETIRGIDERPSTGELYAVTATSGSVANSVVRTYAIPHAAVAIPVGNTGAALPGWADVVAGSDFNPVVDRLRLVNANDENARINPFNGALAGNDTDITPAGSTVLVGAAYDRNVTGTGATTLFAIDRGDSELVRIGSVDGMPSSPNGGVATSIGPLGFTLNGVNDAGFDIAPDGTAYAALTDDADDLTRLYRIDLATGAATALGLIGSGSTEVRSLAVVLPEPPGPPGPAGPAGPAGAVGPAGPPGAALVRDRLAAALAADRYSGRARKRLVVRFVTTVRALVTLELRRGSRVVAKVAGQVGPGRARLAFRRLLARGRYALRLTAVAGDETVTDRGSVRVRR
jgi:Domain of unknown function (DUF4394)